MATRTAATVEDVLRLGAHGERYELIDGELVPMSPTGFQHGDVEAFVAYVLNSYVIPRDLGKVAAGEALFRLDPRRGLARAPDVAFVRQERITDENLAGAFDGAPDLAVEIVSPSDTAKDVQRKVEDWLGHGTIVVLLMYPETRSMVIWRVAQAVSAREGDEVDLADAVPGFRCPVTDLFPRRLAKPPQNSDQDMGASS
jgi:Uma2 family endonuclease